MALMIKYDAPCFYCQKMCKKGHAYLHKHKGAWYSHCMDCYKKHEEERKEKLREMNRKREESRP